MPRRKQKHIVQVSALTELLLVSGALAVIGVILPSLPRLIGLFGSVVLIVLAVSAICLFIKLVVEENAKRQLNVAARTAIDRHMDTLVTRRAQLRATDAYGAVQSGRWEKEVRHFIETQIVPPLSPRKRLALQQRHSEFVQLIEHRVADAAANRPALQSLSDNATPVEYEAFCAEQLRQAGWDARVTKRSHDQGVDVIADMNGIRIALQCKLYSRPIGNKAVQEVAAGRVHERANYAAVVSRTSYTPGAEELARTNGVLLLHHSQLSELETLIDGLARASEQHPARIG